MAKQQCRITKKSGKTQRVQETVPVVVEAVKSEPVTAPAAQTETPETTSRSEAPVVTAERIHKNAQEFYSLYSRYNDLRELAKVLNKLPTSTPLPETVKLHGIDLVFEIDNVVRSVRMADVRTIGEIAPLIASSLSQFIELMHQEIFTLTASSAAMQQAIENTIARREPAPQTSSPPPT